MFEIVKTILTNYFTIEILPQSTNIFLKMGLLKTSTLAILQIYAV